MSADRVARAEGAVNVLVDLMRMEQEAAADRSEVIAAQVRHVRRLSAAEQRDAFIVAADLLARTPTSPGGA